MGLGRSCSQNTLKSTDTLHATPTVPAVSREEKQMEGIAAIILGVQRIASRRAADFAWKQNGLFFLL
jgi:hypothetical protein